MAFTFSIYFLPLMIAVALCILIAIYTWRYREIPEGRALFLLAIVAGLWAAANVLEYGFNALAIKSFWARFEYFGIEAVPICWLVVVSYYTGRHRWINRRSLLLLSIIPLITVIMIWTNPWHGLMRYNIALDTEGPYSIITKTYGPWFWVAMLYNNSVMIAATVLLFRCLSRLPRLQHRQVILLLICALVPWIGNILYVFKLNPWPRIDLSTTFLSISGAVMTFGLFRFQILDVIPLAREYILEHLSDSILILDSRNRIVDCNRACQKMSNLDVNRKTMPAFRELEELRDLHDSIITTNSSSPRELTIKVDAEQRVFDLRIDILHNRKGKLIGRILHFHDITARKKAEAERERIISELQEALDKVNTLSGFLPICANCKKIRDDSGYWDEVENYISKHSKAQFSHTLCNDCLKKRYPEQYERLRKKGKLKE